MNKKIKTKEKFLNLSGITILSMVLIAGSATALVVTNTLNFQTSVEEGLNYNNKGLTIGGSSTTFDSPSNINSGDTLNVSADLVNDANTESPNTAEVLTFSDPNGDLSAGDIQRVEFTADALSGPPSGNTVNEVIEFDSGSYDSVTGYLGVAESSGDILACVGDDTMTFASGEEWEKQFDVETSHAISADSIDVELELFKRTKYDGSLNPEITGCPQYNP